tara:strand:- start:454 stop:1587 length:1134 start_codon:yes stop_codon:yes gene_type:complete
MTLTLFRATSLLLLLPTLAFAAIGEVTEHSGSGAVERDEGFEVYEVTDGLGVESMDTVVTEKGKVRIDFIDDTRVDITEHSRLIIDDFVYDPASQEGSLSLKAGLGTIRYASGKIAKNSRQRVRIETPSAVVGVRGTDFAMIVDEIGGSMVTLLPSCDTNGDCIVGEISVTSDVGTVIMNQAFQTTIVRAAGSSPTKPVILDISEDDMNNMLIIRKARPYDPDGEIAVQQARQKLADLLGIDFLETDVLEKGGFEDEDQLWRTELDNTEFYLGELLIDIMDQLNAALNALLRGEFAKQEAILSFESQGYNEETGTRLEIREGNWILERHDYANGQYWQLTLDNGNGYNIGWQQGDAEFFDYRLGDGINSIYIRQTPG